MMQRLSDLRLRKGLESIYITEDHSEQFIDVMDGMLVWHWSSGGLVPAFSAVYSDQVELFGRNYPLAEKLSEEDRKYARITFAEQMTFGDQLGWNVSFLKNSGRVQTDMDMYSRQSSFVTNTRNTIVTEGFAVLRRWLAMHRILLFIEQMIIIQTVCMVIP